MRALALDDTPEQVLRWDDGAECESIVHCNGDGSEGKGEGNGKDDREGNSKGYGAGKELLLLDMPTLKEP
jgi:hypothetical protein